MKSMALLMALASLLLCSCVPIPLSEVSYHDDKVTVKYKSWWYFPWVHGVVCERDVIRVCGVPYENVRGTHPYYLQIPDTNRILFVTGGDSAVIHIVDLDTRKAHRCRAYDSSIGMDIGRQERIVSVENGVALITAPKGRKYWIDLNKPKMVREEYYTWAPDKKWYHWVFDAESGTSTKTLVPSLPPEDDTK
jgi:hypothetical protein